MKRCIAVLVGALAVSAQAKTHVFDVPAGQTKTFTEMLTAEGATLADKGDFIIKRGAGILQWNDGYSDKSFVLTNEAGVVAITDSKAANKKGGKIFVKDGATFSIATGFGQVLQSWRFYFEGRGTGVAPYLGALVCEKTNGNGQILYGYFELTGDATIYTTKGVANYMFSASKTSDYSELNMQKHTLTLLGAGATGDSNGSLFRPRWGWKITNEGTIVADNILFARHANSAATMDVYTLPCIKLVNGAKISLDGYFYKKVTEFDFDYGTTMGFKVSSPGSGGNTGATPTLKNLTGAPTIASATSSCTVTNLFAVRAADLAEGHYLTAGSSTLAFGTSCKVKISDVYAKSWTEGTGVTIATAKSITGTPTIDDSQMNLFTVAKNGTELTVTPKFTSISVADWGIKPGEENAAANAAAIAGIVSSLVDGTPVIFSEAGDYYFGEYLDLSGVTAANVRFLKLDTLTDAVNVHSTIKVGAAANFAVEGLTVKDVAGPAVIATGTQGLTIKNLTADAVVGTYGEKAYPFVFNGVTGLEVTGFTAANCGENKWTDQALYTGAGSQTADSALREGEIVAVVLKGKGPNADNPDWHHMSSFVKDFHLEDAAYSNKTLVVTGDGATLDGGVSLLALGVTNVVIKKGQYVARSNNALGVANRPVTVLDGGALTIVGKNEGIKNRTVKFEGNGLREDTPAIRFTGTADWNKAYYITYELTGDATMYNNCTGECGTFVYSKVKTNGHTLTLKGVDNSNYRFGRACEWIDGGEVIVKKGVTLSASSKTGSGYRASDGLTPKFTFEENTKFLPDNEDIFDLVKDCAFANTATLATKSGVSGVAATFAALKGAPVVGDGIASVTVSGTYLANQADLAKGKYLAMNGAFVWGADAVADVDAADGVKGKTILKAEGGITKKPKTGEVLNAAHCVVQNEDAKTQVIGAQGLSLFVR